MTQQSLQAAMRKEWESAGQPKLARDTMWVCCFCGADASGAADPSVFICCGEIGHVEEVDAETGERIE